MWRHLDARILIRSYSCFKENACIFTDKSEFKSRLFDGPHKLKIHSRNRRFILSFDTTKEAFYGESVTINSLTGVPSLQRPINLCSDVFPRQYSPLIP